MRQDQRTAIFIPTFGRAHKLADVFENIILSTLLPINVYFICEKNDPKSIESVKNTNGAQLIINEESSSYTGAINHAFSVTREPFFFVASDDLNFHKGWLEQASKKMKGKIKVVGTNDLLSERVMRGGIATHFLVDREYIWTQSGTIDESYPVLFEYNHYCCDVEFIETAKFRGVFTPCLESIVEHMHPENNKADFDATYLKNVSTLRIDRNTFNLRKALWQ